MADFNYEVTQELGVISENARGWLTKLNMVSWNGKEPKYDIRTWSPDGEKMGKGISLTLEEMEQLVVLWNDRDAEDTFE
ncbi:MAG: PC4/YdbC family ssDNA-binding protein [Oscillospiraceae bacterium]|nr:PC4/YdbC family ssDNA-binding protein [Oscillospiraceae bacterium]